MDKERLSLGKQITGENNFMNIKIKLNEQQSDLDNILFNGMMPIMREDIRPAFIKCNPQDVDKINKSGLKNELDKENTYAGMQLIESDDVKLSEIFIISE